MNEAVVLPANTRREGAFATLRRGLRMMPEFRRGLPVTFALALVATAGRVVVPIAVQQTLDRGLGADGGPDIPLVRGKVEHPRSLYDRYGPGGGELRWRLLGPYRS